MPTTTTATPLATGAQPVPRPPDASRGSFRWAWRIGRVAGIDLYVHATFPLLFVWVAAQELGRGGGWPAVAASSLLVASVFAVVVLHEYGHALTARRFGVPTRDITLLPIGGVARLEKMPERPSEELRVAIAGPLVNVAIAAVLWAGLQAAGAPVVPAGGNVAALPFAAQFLWVNVMLVVFNLIPAFPMDGGRVLRALLAMRMSRVRATQVAATLGKVFAFGFGLLGLYSNPMLVLIAVFVWVGATSEASGVRLEAALGHRTVRDAMITQFDVLHPHDPVSRAVERTLAGFQRDFPVVDGARLAGLLTQQDLVRALALHGPDVPVAEVMQRAVTVVSAATPVTEAMPKVLSPSRSTVLVVEDGRVAGLLTADNLAELLVFSEAAGRQR